MDNSSEPHSPLNEEFAKLRKFLIFIYLRPGPQIVKELEAYFCLSSDYFPQPFPCQILVVFHRVCPEPVPRTL